MPSRRQSRVNDLLREEISSLIHREVQDPRLAEVVTITEVSVSPDLRSARVYVSILGTEEEKGQTLEGLRAASAFIRNSLKKRISLRHVPHFIYQLDQSIEEGAHLLTLMKEAAEGTTNQAPGQD